MVALAVLRVRSSHLVALRTSEGRNCNTASSFLVCCCFDMGCWNSSDHTGYLSGTV